MGNTVSRTDDLMKNEYVVKFIGTETISTNDPFWNRFLAFNLKLPTTSIDQSALDLQIEPVGQHLLKNNVTSGNINCLVHIFLMRAAELLAATNTDDNLFTWQTFNALFTLRCIIKYLVENVNEEQLIQHIENGIRNDITVETLIGSLVGIIVDVPLKDFTYFIHLESITCLLVFLSSTIHFNKRADQSVIYRLMMRGKHSIHSPLFIRSLLENFIEQKRPPLEPNQGHSIVLGFAAELWSMLTFNRKSNENTLDNNGELTTEYQETPLSMQSLLMLLVLTNHFTTQQNPYRLSLFSCVNSADNGPLPPTKTPTIFKINYHKLFDTLCRRANGECATLLLYLLLHRNATFKNFLLNSPNIDQLIIPILKTLYHAPNSNSHHIYMSLIILLILSEDDTFNRNVHEIKLKHVTWYTERALSEVSLGGLLVLVVIRTIQYNMLKMRDKYLHTNCLAALANMSGQFRNLHPYVSQRLVSLFETLAKRYQKILNNLQEHQQQENNVTKEHKMMVDGNEENQIQDVNVLEEVLRMVLEIFNSCLSNKLSNNPNLVYTLLYKRHVFEPFRNNVAFQDIIKNIDIIIEYFSNLLNNKSQHNEVDAQQVLNIIQEGTKNWPKEKLTKFPDLKFKYVEEDQPEEFFIPYVWCLVSQKSILHCNQDNTQLLNVSC